MNIGIDKNRKNELVQCLEEETTKKESRSKKSMNRKRPMTPPHEIDEPSTQKPQDTTEISLVPPSTLIQYNKSGIKASLRYIINGEAGQINIDTSCGTNSISVDDLMSNICRGHLTAEKINKDDKARRIGMSYTRIRFNGVDMWIPVGMKPILTQYYSLLTSKAAKIDRLVNLFSKEKCMLDRSSMRMLAGFSMHNSGGSDQATVLQYDVAWKVIFMEFGLEISNVQIAKGSPCQTSMSNADFRLAAECYLLVAYEMKDAKY